MLNRRTFLSALAAMLLAGCSGGGGGVPNPFGNDSGRGGIQGVPTTGVDQKPLDAIGSGSSSGIAKVALILPLSATGNAGKTAQSLRNAAEMALAEIQNPTFELMVLDDKGTPQGAADAATQAMSQGAELVLGPLFAPSVTAVSQIARPQNVPVIAYSTDMNVAAPGTYLFSFLPQADVSRVVKYAAQNGKRRFVGLIPDNGYGLVAEQAFRQSVAAAGGTVVAVERYPLDRVKLFEPARRAAVSAKQADAILIPDVGDSAALVVEALKSNGVDLASVQLLGTGLWDDAKIAANKNFANGIYAAPENAGWAAFKTRYKTRYNMEPIRIASLSYDSVRLVAALARGAGIKANAALLTNPNGFSGIDGIFRFNPDGTNERSLAVMAVGGNVLSPAVKSFAASGN